MNKKLKKEQVKNSYIKKAGSRSYSEVLKIVEKIQSKIEELPA